MDWLKGLATALLLPILPERERRNWPWADPFPPGFLLYFTAFLHVGASAMLWGLAFTAYQKAFGDAVAAAMFEKAQGSGDYSPFYGWAGILGFFTFPFTPKGFFAWAYLLDSVSRFASAMASSEYLASLFLWLPIWVIGKFSGGVEEARRIRTYGRAGEPDRILEDDLAIRVRGTRPHPEWHGALAFHFKGNLFRLAEMHEVREGDRLCYEYRMEPWPEHDVVRRIVVLGVAEVPGE